MIERGTHISNKLLQPIIFTLGLVLSLMLGYSGQTKADELTPAEISAPPSFSEAKSNTENRLEQYRNKGQDLILKGLELVGIRYKSGGTSETNGFDCSGFVQAVFRDSIGEELPRTASEQSKLGDKIDKTDLKPGDLVFFNTMRKAFSHVGIYLGNNQFLHAPSSGKNIRIDDMGASYWVKRYNGARRILSDTNERPSHRESIIDRLRNQPTSPS